MNTPLPNSGCFPKLLCLAAVFGSITMLICSLAGLAYLAWWWQTTRPDAVVSQILSWGGEWSFWGFVALAWLYQYGALFYMLKHYPRRKD